MERLDYLDYIYWYIKIPGIYRVYTALRPQQPMGPALATTQASPGPPPAPMAALWQPNSAPHLQLALPVGGPSAGKPALEQRGGGAHRQHKQHSRLAGICQC